VARAAGDAIRSGSFAVEGTGVYEVEAVGAESYAERLAARARVYERLRSPLERAFNRLLLLLVAVMLPLAAILGYSLWARETGVREAVTTSTAAVVSLVPEGLILLMSLTFAVGALRMARRGALAQRLNAIESLASADVVCFDKTGTLTESGLRVVDLLAAPGTDARATAEALGRYAASVGSRNETVRALARSYPGDAEEPSAEVPFASQRRWSGVQLGQDAYILGAPELFPLDGLSERVEREQAAGRRVVAFATSREALDSRTGRDSGPPPRADVLGVVVLAEPLRPEARETVRYFLAQDVALKVFSGDHPATVGAIAADAGMELSEPAVDGSRYPEDSPELRRTALEATVIGRLSPDQKSACVKALRDSGRHVVMVGDGVNDVPALKAARLAIAQGSGVQMAKSVADVVLVKGGFEAVPAMVDEGRQMLRNLQRVAKLYVSKSAFAAFLILTVGTTATAYPLLPRHFSLVAALTIGVPTFFLALAPSTGPWRASRFFRELGRFAIPAGVGAGVAVVASYQFALNALELSLIESRTVAATALLLVGLFLVIALEGTARRRGKLVTLLCVALGSAYALALALPSTRDFFELAVPTAAIVVTAIVGSAIAVSGLLASGFPPAGEHGGRATRGPSDS
jgi:magnesium-transporting ATPase (P-type)